MIWVFHWSITIPDSKKEFSRERKIFLVLSEDLVRKEYGMSSILGEESVNPWRAKNSSLKEKEPSKVLWESSGEEAERIEVREGIEGGAILSEKA